MNLARIYGSAFVGQMWTALWICFLAPVLAMQLAAIIYLRGKRTVYCAKFHHHNAQRCIFNCRFAEVAAQESSPSSMSTSTTVFGTRKLL